MAGRSFSPRGLFWAHGFARGQAEFFRCDRDDALRRLERGRAILERAGFSEATRSFVPPAWLLSPPARRVVAEAGFDLVEVLGGIMTSSGLRARRLIGWGSLNAVEAAATVCWSALQRRRRPADVRLAVHPADLARPLVTRAIADCVRHLRPRHRVLTYRDYLAGR